MYLIGSVVSIFENHKNTTYIPIHPTMEPFTPFIYHPSFLTPVSLSRSLFHICQFSCSHIHHYHGVHFIFSFFFILNCHKFFISLFRSYFPHYLTFFSAYKVIHRSVRYRNNDNHSTVHSLPSSLLDI